MRGRMLAAMAMATIPTLALAQSSGVTPGLWEIAVTVNSVDMPGAPPFVAKMMLGKTTRVKQCVTPEQAAAGPQEMLKSNKSCTMQKYSMAGGKMNSDMTCASGGQTTRMVSTGTFTPTAFTSSGRSVSTGSMAMTMTSTATGKLIGPCKK